MSEEAKSNGHKNKLALLGIIDDENYEERIGVMSIDDQETDIAFIFGALDHETKRKYDRIVNHVSKRGGFDIEEQAQKGIVFLFGKKCKRVEGLSSEDCYGEEPLNFFVTNPKARSTLNTVTNEYLRRMLPSAEERSKSR